MRKATMVMVAGFVAFVILGSPPAWSQKEVVLSAKEAVLVVVDMQNDFAAPGGMFASERSIEYCK